jgi:uncharacterized membrane protein YccC
MGTCSSITVLARLDIRLLVHNQPSKKLTRYHAESRFVRPESSRRQEELMAEMRGWAPLGWDRDSIVHAARTAVAAIVSLYIARLCKLHEAYWAAITTIIVMQSSLGAALKVSGERLAGTALGATAGGLLAARFGQNAVVFAAGVFALGLVCSALRLERNAYRYAGVTLAVVMLVARDEAAWSVAAHRFVEVAIGIVVGLVVTALWRERQPPEWD